MARQDGDDVTHFTSMTFALIKPDALERRLVGDIIGVIEERMQIRSLRLGFPSVDCWYVFYQEHQGRAYFNTLVQFMASGPVIGMLLTLRSKNGEWKDGEASPAVREWRGLMGASAIKNRIPGTIRHLFALDQPEYRNLVHGSDSDNAVEREIKIAERWSLL